MIGLEIKVVGKSRALLLEGLQAAIAHISQGDSNAFVPLNDINDTVASYCICDIGELSVFDDWSGTDVITSD